MSAGMLAMILAVSLLSTPELGTEEARCRPNEPGPAVMIEVAGLKDRAGLLRAELYPDDDRDFMADDNILIAQHKVFRRIDMALPATGSVWLCLRAPVTGSYTLALLHDRDGDHKFEPLRDGAGFPGNPRLALGRPKAAAARLQIGPGVTDTRIVMNYLRGLLSFGPLPTRR